MDRPKVENASCAVSRAAGHGAGLGRRLSWGLALLLIVAAALAWRLPDLGGRPMHADESVHASKLNDLATTGRYEYDPTEFHGPSLYYLSWPVLRAQGHHNWLDWNEADMRRIIAVLGAAMILFFFWLSDGLGRGGTLGAALLLAISPAMVFYSRYYIHEIPLLVFTLGALACGWRYWRSRGAGWAIGCGLFIGLMHATKETFVFTLAAAAGGLAGEWAWRRWTVTPAEAEAGRRPMRAWHLLAGAGAGVVVSVVLFSAFFTHPRGIIDSVWTYATYLGRGAGSGDNASLHVHPWWYYLQLLGYWQAPGGPIWSEGLILLLAVLGAATGFVRRSVTGAHQGLVRFLAIYTVLVFAAYSVIPYKTPWLILTALQGLILLAGVGAAMLLRRARWKWGRAAVAVVLALGAGQLMVQTQRANGRPAVLGAGFDRLNPVLNRAAKAAPPLRPVVGMAGVDFSARRENPYVYAHTAPDALNLIARINELAAVSPGGRKTMVLVMTDYSWPLPWYLRRFERMGFWDRVPEGEESLDAPLIIVAAEQTEALEAKLKKPYGDPPSYFALRPGVYVALYVRQDLWEKFLAGRR